MAYGEGYSRRAERKAWSVPPDAHDKSRRPTERAWSWWWKATASNYRYWVPRFRRVIPVGTRPHSDTDGDLQTIFPSAMILRYSSFWLSLAFANLLFALGVTAQDGNNPFNCHVQTNDLTYDLIPLQGEHTVSRTRETPPSSWVDSIRFDLCADLKPQDGVAAGDQVRSHPNTRFQVAIYSLSPSTQCPAGTRACLTKTNRKSDSSDRVVAVIPLAQSSTLDPKYHHIVRKSMFTLKY